MDTEPKPQPLTGIVAFTGKLASMTRVEAFELVRRSGGTPRRGLTKGTGLLVVGQLGWPLLADGRPAKSLSLAAKYGVPVASEQHFLEWAGRASPDKQEIRNYSAAQVANLSGLPAGVIEQLTAFGLLDAREGQYGFTDVAAARQVAELLGSGVTLSTITRSLHDIRKWLPEAALSNLRLSPESSDAIVVDFMKGRTDRTGQLLLPVDQTRDDPDDLFDQAQAAEEAGAGDVAERLYQKVMRIDPDDAAAAFNLGNLLRTMGKPVEAEAAFRAAVKADPRYAEAWYNLADLLDKQGQSGKALECLNRALDANPDYADAVFNLALLLQRLERHADAVAQWRRYLDLDPASAWADRARRALKFCEMQIAQTSRIRG